MKTTLLILILQVIPALAREPHIIARWGGELVHLRVIATGQEWTDTYENFFRNCGGYHPNECGVRVIGSLPASFLARERAAKLAKAAPAPTPRPTPAPAPKAKETPKKPAPSKREIIEEPLPSFDGSETMDGLPPLLLPDLEKVGEEPQEEQTEYVSVITGQPMKIEKPEPRTTPLVPVEISGSYDVRRRGIVTAGRLDQILNGVLAGHGQDFIDAAREGGICPIFLAGVAMHESGNGTSRIAREKLNAFGIFKDGKYIEFDSIKEGIFYTARMLGGSGYVTRKKDPLTTISAIHRRYCPIGVNDPKNLNHHWTNGVVHHMKQVHGPTLYVAAR